MQANDFLMHAYGWPNPSLMGPGARAMSNVTLRQLEVFEAVARHLSYSRAAEELHMTQPGVSMHVHQLERRAGLPLFEQLGRRIFLTAAGEEMLRYGRAMMQEMKEADSALAALTGIQGGRLNVAVISAGDHFFPGLLATFCRRHPGVVVSLCVDNRAEVLHRLGENTTDLAVLLRPPEGGDFCAEAFAPQPQVIVAPPTHRFAASRRIPLAALAREPFIVRERGSDTRLAWDEVAAAADMPFNVTMEIKSTETIKQAVMAGMGVAFLSAHTIGMELELRRLAVLDIVGFPVVRNWHVVHHRAKRLPPPAAAFKSFLLREGAAMIERLVGRGGRD